MSTPRSSGCSPRYWAWNLNVDTVFRAGRGPGRHCSAPVPSALWAAQPKPPKLLQGNLRCKPVRPHRPDKAKLPTAIAHQPQLPTAKSARFQGDEHARQGRFLVARRQQVSRQSSLQPRVRVSLPKRTSKPSGQQCSRVPATASRKCCTCSMQQHWVLPRLALCCR